jgi:hypothetical protein
MPYEALRFVFVTRFERMNSYLEYKEKQDFIVDWVTSFVLSKLMSIAHGHQNQFRIRNMC